MCGSAGCFIVSEANAYSTCKESNYKKSPMNEGTILFYMFIFNELALFFLVGPLGEYFLGPPHDLPGSSVATFPQWQCGVHLEQQLHHLGEQSAVQGLEG